MQKCSKSAKTLFRSATIFALSIWSLQSHAGLQESLILANGKIFGETKAVETQGPRTGGGGNACALGITQNSRKLMSVLDNLPNLLSEKQKEKFFAEIATAKFYVRDGLVLDGEAKDAINYPEENKIVVSPKLCRTDLFEVSGRAMSLLLHEYLGLAKIPDKKHQISGPFLERYGDLMSASAVLQYTDSNLELAQAALQIFLKQANNPKTKIGQLLQERNKETTDGHNNEGTIVFPITKDSVQLVVINEETAYNPWFYAERKDNKCITIGDNATYYIFLNTKSEVHNAGEFEALQFKVSAEQVLSQKILKASPTDTPICGGFADEESDTSTIFEKEKTTYRTSEIEYVQPK